MSTERRFLQSQHTTQTAPGLAFAPSAVKCSVAALQTALQQKQLVLEYQPKVDLHTGLMVSTEALVRWAHPQHGVIGPDHFIPMAEDSGLIVELGAWVIDQACAQLRQWRRMGGPALTMAVNLSPRQLNDEAPAIVERALKRHALEPSSLCLEVTESVAMQDVEASVRILERLQRLGVQCALDDFGAGYSGIGSLQAVMFDEIKLDRGLLRGRGSPAQRLRLIRAIVALARCFGSTVVAEGIENEGDAELVLAAGCHWGQGFHFSRPESAATISQWMAEAALRHPLGYGVPMPGDRSSPDEWGVEWPARPRPH